VAFGGGISLLALVALGQPAPAAPAASIPVRVSFDAPRGCSGINAFYNGVLSRLDRASPARDGEDGPRLRVRLTRAGGKVHGELRIVSGQGATDTRKVDGTTCDEVVEVLSLTAALALDPAARLSPGPGAPAGTAGATGNRSSATAAATGGATRSQGGNPTSAPTVATTATATTAAAVRTAAPPPAAPAPPAPVPPPEDKVPAAVEPLPSPGPAVSIAAPPGAPSRQGSLGVELGARAAVAEVVSPYASVGGALVARLTQRRRDRPERPDEPDPIDRSLGLALLYLPNDSVQSGHGVVVTWSALALTACPGWGLRRSRLVLEACALAMGGWLAASDHAVTNPRSAGRSWWSAGALLRAAIPLGAGPAPRLAVELEAGVSAPLVRRSFVTTTPERTVAETPAVSALVDLGLSIKL
jgi:hypothetical protein